MRESLQNTRLEPLPGFSNAAIEVSILRLDLLHPVVSGNKWFKLQYYLKEALASGKTTIASFGGAYSNHIVATAYAAKQAGLKSIGYIRGEMNTKLTPTLRDANEYGMQLVFTDRGSYRDKDTIMQQNAQPAVYWIMEGGYGIPGANGAAGILNAAETRDYTDIICAVGTGTMMAGLIKAAETGQRVTGISVLKNHFELENDVRALLTNAEKERPFTILHDYHFGGYAKYNGDLLGFMNQTWQSTGVPTDIVYTAKLLFAARDLLEKGYFVPGSRLLIIHSGGLQGNRSLPQGTLDF
jgi:1-aminocyclopropane-1-carboxylate deaminase